jgi:putative ABC transport system substrate-binding protein
MKTLPLACAGLLLALGLGSVDAAAQEEGRIYKIGWLWTGSWGYEQPALAKWAGPGAVFRDSLRAAGYDPGKNLIVEARHAQGDDARLVAEAEALVAADVDVIVAGGSMPTIAAMQATKRIPIVFFGVSYPVEKGIVTSRTRPGGNVTGTEVTTGPKQWQLLREVAPTVRHAGRLENAALRPAGEHYAVYRRSMFEEVKADAASVGIEPMRMGVFGLNDVEPLFGELARRGNAGLVVINDPLLFSLQWRPTILQIAVRHRLPTSCARERGWAQSGCLVTYAEDWSTTMQGVAAQVVKVMRRTKPADIPVEQSSHHKLIINIKTANALGLTVPQSILAHADEVIE